MFKDKLVGGRVNGEESTTFLTMFNMFNKQIAELVGEGIPYAESLQ